MEELIIRCLSTLGLIMDLVGAVIIFWGFKSSHLKQAFHHGVTFESENKTERNVNKFLKIYGKYSKIGLSFLALGFLLQILSQILSLCKDI